MSVIQDNSDSRSKLEQEINRLETVSIDNSAKPQLPEVKLDEISYTAPSDEYIKIRAENSLADYRKNGEQALKDESALQAKTLADKRDAYTASRTADEKALEQSYAESKRAVDNDAIKRGLARSSVASVANAELEKEYLSRNADIASSYGKKISELDAELNSLESKLKSALNDFNLSYATRLNDKIAELASERDAKIEQVTKFNNDVRVKQAALDEDRARADSDLYTAAQKQQSSASSLDGLSEKQRDEIYKSVYDEMDKFLSSLSPDQARLEIRNHTLYKQHLSSYYFYKLYDKYGR